MKIVVSPTELFEQGIWDKLCELRGWNPYIVNEGQMDRDERIELSLDEVQKIGFRFLTSTARNKK